MKWALPNSAARWRRGEVSSVEVTKHLIARVAQHEQLGSMLCVDESNALSQAQQADAKRAAGDSGPLLGVPLAHKDIFVTRDLPTTAGSKILADYRSPFDATVVARLADAGVVALGKLNCDEFAMGSGNENSAYGPVRNPWDLGPRAGRLLGRFGRCGGRAPDAGRHRHRHRRLDPPAGELHRHHRDQADLWRVLALRDDRVRLQPRPGRPARPQRRRLRAAARRDERLRRPRLDQRPAPPAGLPRRDAAGAPRREHGAAVEGACASACRRSSSRPRWPPT